MNFQLESQIIPAADKPGPDSDENNKNDSLSDADKETLNLLNAKLSEATQLYQKVSKDILKYQQVMTTWYLTLWFGGNKFILDII